MATNSRLIDVDRQRVFAALSDGWCYSNWVVGTSHMRAVESGWPAVGSRLFHASGAWPFVTRDDTTVEECEPGRRLVLRASGGPAGDARIVLELADEAGGCRVTMHETPVSGLGHWLHNPVSEAVLLRRNVESLARLAAVAERRTAPSE
jgi:uncharacterized protein YndB with AHSA1/START domain